MEKNVIEMTHKLPLVAVASAEISNVKADSNRNKDLKAKVNSVSAKF